MFAFGFEFEFEFGPCKNKNVRLCNVCGEINYGVYPTEMSPYVFTLYARSPLLGSAFSSTYLLARNFHLPEAGLPSATINHQPPIKPSSTIDHWPLPVPLPVPLLLGC